MNTHPFVSWISSLESIGMLASDGEKSTDLQLTPLGAKRFALGVHEGEPLLCWPQDDDAAISSIKWSSAAMIFARQDRDWIALSCKDIRHSDAATPEALAVRLFIPVTNGRLNVWRSAKPERLHVGTMGKEMKNGRPALAGRPSKSFALKVF